MHTVLGSPFSEPKGQHLPPSPEVASDTPYKGYRPPLCICDVRMSYKFDISL